MNKYLKEYKVSDMRAMLRNNKTDPKECTEEFNGRLVVISGTTAALDIRLPECMLHEEQIFYA